MLAVEAIPVDELAQGHRSSVYGFERRQRGGSGRIAEGVKIRAVHYMTHRRSAYVESREKSTSRARSCHVVTYSTRTPPFTYLPA